MSRLRLAVRMLIALGPTVGAVVITIVEFTRGSGWAVASMFFLLFWSPISFFLLTGPWNRRRPDRQS